MCTALCVKVFLAAEGTRANGRPYRYLDFGFQMGKFLAENVGEGGNCEFRRRIDVKGRGVEFYDFMTGQAVYVDDVPFEVVFPHLFDRQVAAEHHPENVRVYDFFEVHRISACRIKVSDEM